MIDPLLQIWLALALDGCIGDPRRWPHPVRLIGRWAALLERPARRMIRSAKAAGLITAAMVVCSSGLAAAALLHGAAVISPMVHDILAIVLLYTCFAARDLADHSREVQSLLATGDLAAARQSTARMVGRDTRTLDENGIVRATVESVAENTVDGVIAPLFFAFLFGPVGAVVFKAVSTLDSLFGYRNERYRLFGWASARLDDLANYVPARLAIIPITLAAAGCGRSAAKIWRIFRRDSRKHASPNAGYPEAAFAAALAVQLGGPVLRGGKLETMPLMGDPGQPLHRSHIGQANAVLALATLWTAILLTVCQIVWNSLEGVS
ncbi:MAG: hypothetical protein VR64_19415 [Desulfatitalea sp. BRH_c12]|nr:MAG: hypothetical protein VR64_19415 [Desulfatitalea sp. BRH_c12]